MGFGPFEIAFSAWLIDKATGGLLAEYVKRFWFSKVHRIASATDQAAEELRAAREKYDSINRKVDALLTHLDDLERENIVLRVENNRLRSGEASAAAPEGDEAPPSSRSRKMQ